MKHAIIGCGRVAGNHVFGSKQSGIDVKWCCDLDNLKLHDFAKKHKISKKTINYFDILKDDEVTSVSICTDHGSHSKIAVDALNYGKHVVIEKPIATTLNEAIEIIETRNKNKKIVTVCFQHRFDPLIQKIKETIDRGDFGKITAINANIQCSKTEKYYNGWRGKTKTEGGSSLINQGIHTLDLLLWFFGIPIVHSVLMKNQKFSRKYFETEDTLTSLFEFNNGALCTFLTTNTSIVEWDSYIEIIGLKGRISFTTDFPNLIYKLDIENELIKQELQQTTEKRDFPPPSMNYYGVSHKDVLNNFFNSILGQEDLFISAEEGLNTLSVVNKIYFKANNGKK